MTFIWLARGRSWGFRFLRDGGFVDPLHQYEEVFDELDLPPDGYQRVGDRVALRLRDPEQRTDRSGRPITHDFVLFGELADRVTSVGDGLREVWPLVSAEYSALWDTSIDPSQERG